MTLTGKRVLVTGAGGSIATAVCERIAPVVSRLVMANQSESAMYRMRERLGVQPHFQYELGSVEDPMLMEELCTGIDVVIHAAAHKHVPFGEENVCEFVLNNVGGTDCLVRAAKYAKVERFLLVSTDKAVRPVSVMGATKRVAERIVASQVGPTVWQTVRFGNVMDTDGSVLPRWRKRIREGLPVEVTHPEVERYFMSMEQAVGLILNALTLGAGTYVFDMGEPRRLIDMARELMDEMRDAGETVDVPIVFTQLRPGEKLTEELHHGGELVPTECEKVFRIADPTPPIARGDLSALLHRAHLRQEDRAKRLLFEAAGEPMEWEEAA